MKRKQREKWWIHSIHIRFRDTCAIICAVGSGLGKQRCKIRLRKKLNLLPGSGRESERVREPAGNRCELMRVEEGKLCVCV